MNGCVRDVDAINGCDIGVRAIAVHPMKANKKGIGEKNVAIHIGGARIHDGEWLYADTDGVLISKSELHPLKLRLAIMSENCGLKRGRDGGQRHVCDRLWRRGPQRKNKEKFQI